MTSSPASICVCVHVRYMCIYVLYLRFIRSISGLSEVYQVYPRSI